MKSTSNLVKLIQENKPKEIVFFGVYWGRGNSLIKGDSEFEFVTGIRLIKQIDYESKERNRIMEPVK